MFCRTRCKMHAVSFVMLCRGCAGTRVPRWRNVSPEPSCKSVSISLVGEAVRASAVRTPAQFLDERRPQSFTSNQDPVSGCASQGFQSRSRLMLPSVVLGGTAYMTHRLPGLWPCHDCHRQSSPRPSKRNYSCILPACLHSYPYPIRTSLYTPVTCFAGQLDKMGRWQKSRCGAESLQVACGSVRKPGRMSSADAMQHAAPLVPQKMYLKKVSKPSLRVLRFFRTQTSMTTTTAPTWELLTSMSCAATHRLSASA